MARHQKRKKENNQVLKTNPPQNSPKMVRVSQAAYFNGPIPPPAVLQQYNEIVPGLAKQICDQANAQTQHRVKIESSVITNNNIKSYLGLVFAFIISMSAVVGGIYVILQGHEITGALISGGSLASLVTTFVYGSQSRKKERLEKYEKARR